MTAAPTGNRAPGAGTGVFLVVTLVAMAASAFAQHEQHAAPGSRTVPGSRLPAPVEAKLPPNLGWEPIRCWRQASAGAVAIGETFTLTLTCAVHDADNAQVIADESRLSVASIQLAPFEILGGAHPPDLRRGSRRFFQYDYQVRVISPDAIGRDVYIPALTISYRIRSSVGAAATLEGRELSYLLPMMPIKVLSLVPGDADDIRDASDASFASIESLRFRANLFGVLTWTFGALAAAMAVFALMPMARGRTAAATPERHRVPARAVAAAAAAELAAVHARAAGAWTDDAIARALAATRLVAAASIGHAISQKPAQAGLDAAGRLQVGYGLLRRTAVSVSSAVTAADVARARAGSAASPPRQQQLERLQDGLSALSDALYRREPARDAAALDEAVRQAIAAAKDVAREPRQWLKF
jgi:hypothetical protein